MHTLICVTFSLPPGVGGWLRLLLVALPWLSSLPFFNGVFLEMIKTPPECTFSMFDPPFYNVEQRCNIYPNVVRSPWTEQTHRSKAVVIGTLWNMSRDMTKPTKWMCAQRRLISAWAYAWWKLGSLATHRAPSEDSDQTGRMPRLIWVFAGCTLILPVLLWGGSY